MDLIKRSFLFFCGLKLPGIVALATLYAGFLTQALGQSRVCNDPAPVSNLKKCSMRFTHAGCRRKTRRGLS